MAADAGRRGTTVALIASLVVMVAGLLALFVVPPHHTRREQAGPQASAPVPRPQPSTTVAVSGTPTAHYAARRAGAHHSHAAGRCRPRSAIVGQR